MPCAFFDMSDSSPLTGSVSGLEPAIVIIGAERHAAARVSMRTLTSFMVVWRVLSTTRRCHDCAQVRSERACRLADE